jgi:Flp pilus assembly protein TadG
MRLVRCLDRRRRNPTTCDEPRRDSGQATVELALTLPLIAVLLLVCIEAGLIVRDQLVAVQIAREAARHAVVGETAPSFDGAASVDLTTTDGLVRARATITHRLHIPVVNRLGPIELSADATMRVESP